MGLGLGSGLGLGLTEPLPEAVMVIAGTALGPKVRFVATSFEVTDEIQP